MSLWRTLEIHKTRERMALIVAQAEYLVARFPHNLKLRDYAAIIIGHASLLNEYKIPVNFRHIKKLSDAASAEASREARAQSYQYSRVRKSIALL